ncbi:MAG TPA: cation transporter, partial [Bacteroidia bacterium]|nr:cation transporter [Bacteroidia bacterium]
MSKAPRTYTMAPQPPEHSHDHGHTHEHSHSPDHGHTHDHSHQHEHSARWVVMITVVTMILEITFGYLDHSMALMAEGWHMSTHVFAIGLTWAAYFFTRRYATHASISFRKEKLMALSGFTSAIILLI